MVFTLNHEEAFETGGVKDGKYEVVVNQVNEDATPGGAEFINIDMIIRNDFEQPCKNAHIFSRIWKSKKDGTYHSGMLNTIGKAFNLPNGKQYNQMQEFFDELAFKTARVTVKNEESAFKTARVTVKNEESEYNGKTYNNLNVKSWEQTELQGMNHQFKDKQASANGVQPTNNPFGNAAKIDIKDDDLPF